MVLHCDSQSAIHLEKNQVYRARTNHIAVWYHRLENGFHLVIFLCRRFSLVRMPLIC